MIRLAIRVRRADAEIVLAQLLDLAPGGIEERDLPEELVELAVYGAPGELPELPDLHAAAGDALVEVSSETIDGDWEERWKSFHEPVLLATPAPGRVPSLFVRAPWEPGRGEKDEIELEIEPGRAFGTGSHATTRLCLELLLALSAELPVNARAHTPLWDLGTGSGVLAIAAAKLGYRPVWALDNDPLSVAAAGENADVNDVSVNVVPFDLRRDRALPWDGTEAGGVLLANLLRPLLLELAGLLERPPAHLVASGLLREEAEEVARAFATRTSLRERARRERGEWAALWLAREP